MKTILPKKWYIVCTEENCKILRDWRVEIAKDCPAWESLAIGFALLSKHQDDDSYYFAGGKRDFLYRPYYQDYEELSFEEFKTLVLGEQPQEPNYEIY